MTPDQWFTLGFIIGLLTATTFWLPVWLIDRAERRRWKRQCGCLFDMLCHVGSGKHNDN